MSAAQVFGPVPSRRLGRSLGLDVVPYKTCSYDCTYCQLGPTTNKTTTRKPYVSADTIKAALEETLSSGVEADYVTLSGSGEPTLNSQLGQMIRAAKAMTDVPVAVLTNGSLLWEQAVAEQVAEADLVIPSLDAALPGTFARLNQPCESLNLETIIEGLSKFTDAFTGSVWVEVMIVEGVNDSSEEVSALRRALESIPAEKVQLNTVVRPPGHANVRAASGSALAAIADKLGPRAEVIASTPPVALGEADLHDIEDQIRACLARRPCTIMDLARSLSVHPNEVAKYARQMAQSGAITVVEHDGHTFFRHSPDS